jgi:4-carboxymuconolactone decarboxylase
MAQSLSYEQRHASAVETFTRFDPAVDPERVAASFTRRQGALGSMAYNVVGAMWSRPQLNRRDRSLLVISTLAAQARDEELSAHTRIGLRHGLEPKDIEEILLHVAAYAGFPAAMASSRRIDAVLTAFAGVEKLPARTASVEKADEDRDRDAAGFLASFNVGGDCLDPAAALAGFEDVSGEVGVIAYRWVYGEVWTREELKPRDRSVVVISILVSLGLLAELTHHVRGGLQHGLTRVEIEEIVNHLSLYAGVPRAIDAMGVVRAEVAKLEKP